MKVQVVVKNLNKNACTSTTIAAIVGPSETALAVQERIGVAMNTLCFTDQRLSFNGNAIPRNQCMSDCGIKDGDMLELAFEASEQTLVKQLSDLLGKHTMAPEELSLLYSLRYSVSVNDALVAVGQTNTKLKTFLGEQKCFSFDGVMVKLAMPQDSTQPLVASAKEQSLHPIQENEVHGPIGVRVSVEIHVQGKMPESLSEDEDDGMDLVRLEASESVARAKKVIAASQQLPFPDCDLFLGQDKLDDQLSLAEAGVANGALLLLVVRASEAAVACQLEELLSERVGLAQNELSLLYCQRFGTPVCHALRTLGLPGNLRHFLASQQRFVIAGGCVTLANGPKLGGRVTLANGLSLATPSSVDDFQECQ